MKVQIKSILMLFTVGILLQFQAMANGKSDERHKTSPVYPTIQKPAFRIKSATQVGRYYEYHLESYLEDRYEDEYGAIETSSFIIVFDVPSPDDLIVEFVLQTTYAGSGGYQTDYNIRVPANIISWHLGTWETLSEDQYGNLHWYRTGDIAATYPAD